jgi:hypothetical protein
MKTTEKIQTKENYIYTISAASRILKIDKYSIESVTFSSVINKFIIQFVDSDPILGGQTRFLTIKDFLNDFANSRRDRRHQILVQKTDSPIIFAATSSKDMMQSRYRLTLLPTSIVCNCKDQEIQRELGLSRQCCKHSYALMEFLGMKTLSLNAYQNNKIYNNIVSNLEF